MKPISLWDTIQYGRIGFKDSEDLKYEIAFGEWKLVESLRESSDSNFNEDEEDRILREKGLRPVEQLIEEYFNKNLTNSLESILFIIADFGKGKSVFMRHYASELAKKYVLESEGYFPIYFNLRDFKNYSSEPRLGVISDFLETKYSIKIDDAYFQKKKYLFLIDSLDESGELSKRAIDKVISSIKSIQGIDKTKYKTNRIIITSRPFDEGLNIHLNEHNPYTILNKEGRDVSLFINVYGFTKFQFNDWLLETLKAYPNLNQISTSGFAKNIVDSILNNKDINIYERLLANQTLSESELRRPIFAYMIYQLIVNNVDFVAVGKLGVYLSFLNLLTKEAKHIHDVNYKVNLKEEFEFRNILQATASLWMHERLKGKQGMLTKADICRVLEGKILGESDNEVLERLKGHGLTEIQFLSHSYFGENDNVLHFQHQSFAEILLAEYYLKIFIKYALDEDSDVEEARVKFILGEPTEQTILFLREMLRLLRDTSDVEITDEIIEKRKLLFPLMASLATKKHNRLFCNEIYYSWYKQCNINENQTQYPQLSLEKWCIDNVKLAKIIKLSADIINSKTSYLPSQAKSQTALFNNEVLEFNYDIGKVPPDIDRWLSLLVGNILFNKLDVNECRTFNSSLKINYHNLFSMIRSWNYYSNESAPSWGRGLFIGINMESNASEISLSHFNFDGIDFSYSHINNMRCWNANWSRCLFNKCSFKDVSIITSLFYETEFNDIKSIEGKFHVANCEVNPNGFKLLEGIKSSKKGSLFFSNFISMKETYRVKKIDVGDGHLNILKGCEGLLIYGLKNGDFKFNDIKKWFTFIDDETKKLFNENLAPLKQYEKKVGRKN